MSCFNWHPVRAKTQAATHTVRRIREVLVIRHLGDVMRVKSLEEAGGLREMKLLVAGLDADKKTVC
jgi:hypothetical protein